MYGINMDKALAKEHEALKKCQTGDMESAHYRRIYYQEKKKLISSSKKRNPTSACTSLRYFYSSNETSLPS